MIGAANAANKINADDAVVRARLGDDDLFCGMREALAETERELLRLCGEASSPRMRRDAERIMFAGGKRLRPTLAYLCRHMGGADNTRPGIVPLMCMLELMHTASLIHDDVVDGAAKRRGIAAINESSGRLAAVQSGDFLLAKAMEKLQYYRGTGVNEALAAVSAEMCRGELQQQRVRYDPEAQDEALYGVMIGRKTASLLSASCFTGALVGGLPEKTAGRLAVFGERFGLAFQILDDLLDFEAEAAFGRPSGQDLQNGVFTLPLLLALRELPDALRALLPKRNKTNREIRSIVEYVRGSGALSRTADRIRLHGEEAVRALAPLADCPEKDALVRLAETIAEQASVEARARRNADAPATTISQ